MTDNNCGAPAEPLRVGGRPVSERLRADLPSLTRRVVDELLAELPIYAELPTEEVHGDISRIVEHNLRLLDDVIARRRDPDDEDMAEQRESAAHRAEEGVPLDAILSAYHIGTARAWDDICRHATAGDLDDLLEISSRLSVLQRRLTSAVSGAYLEVRQILDHQENTDRHALLSALLSGQPIGEVALTTGIRPADSYLVLTLRFGPHRDEAGNGQSARIAARRKIRRVQSVLGNAGPGEPLIRLDAAGGNALLPVAGEPMSWEELTVRIGNASRAAECTVVAAATPAPAEGVSDAVAQNDDIIGLVRRSGRPPGLYRLDDVLLEFQLSRPGNALHGLADLLAPLDDHPDLLETLRVHTRNSFDRRETGRQLHLHPNTVDYRIRRIARLTGLSAGDPGDALHISAALVARQTLMRSS